MTNFDKWKEGLTPEAVNEMRISCEERTSCDRCPAIRFCGKISGLTCNEAFLAWANAPAEEEE